MSARRVSFAITAILLAGSTLPSFARAASSGACAGSRFPAPWCTGVPAGIKFQRTISGDYTARTPRQLIDRWHITGSLIIEAPGVVVRRSQIDDSVLNDTDDIGANSFAISDSTVGPARCGAPIDRPMGVGIARYRAVRVRVRGHEDGFRAGGPNVTIRDSYYKACVKPGSHADGVQDYPAAARPGHRPQHLRYVQSQGRFHRADLRPQR